MATLKELKTRRDSVKSTRRITSTMKTVAAAKLKRASERAVSARPYAEGMAELLSSVLSSPLKIDMPLLTGTGRDDTHLLVVITSDRGLCGGLNSSLLKQVVAYAAKLEGEGKKFSFLTIGRKGRSFLQGRFPKVAMTSYDFGDPQYSIMDEMMKGIIKRFEEGAFDECSIFYNRFVSVLSQVPTREKLIPLAPLGDTTKQVASKKTDADMSIYEFEPEEDVLLKTLVPKSLSVQLFRFALENGASELGARMTAMENATKNAGKMIDDLTITYNRTRQAQITKELIEVISGAEAV